MLDIVSESSRKRQETDRRKVAERELDNLNLKIDKLLLSLEDTKSATRRRFTTEEECVVCLTAAATMQTFPCGHKVVCRKCLIKTIQVAVSKRCLPLRCVVCRDRILRLQNLSHYHAGTCSTTVVPSPSLPSTLIPTALHAGRPVSSPVALAYAFHSNRPSSSPLTPTSPTNVFSLVSSSRYHSSFSRLLSPVGSGVHSLPRLRSSMSVPNNVPRMTHLIQSSLEEDFLRCTPEDNRSLVHFHHNATNRHKRTADFEDKTVTPVEDKTSTSQHQTSAVPQQDLKSTTPDMHRANADRGHGTSTPDKSRSPTPQLNKMTTMQKNKPPTEQDNKILHKQNGQHQTPNIRKLDTPSHNFKHSQSAKIHPTSNDHLSSFMDSPSEHGASSTGQSARVSNNTSQNVSASKFLARFFPKSSRRKCNWFRTE